MTRCGAGRRLLSGSSAEVFSIAQTGTFNRVQLNMGLDRHMGGPHGTIDVALPDNRSRFRRWGEWTTDATATTDCELLVIERRDFLLLMREEPDIALRIIEILCSKLCRTTEQAKEVMSLDWPSRLAKALLRLVDADTAGMRERKISTTQRDLGNIVGMSRESNNKQLRIWEDKKWVRLERNAVVILATDRLAAVAGGGHQCLP
jgi:hypothetical protein